ncbi:MULTISPECIES: hypothetical protein [unclassified Streptomyces]|uniref:hypothetical protein n=1 Tax=unclassified Streptomyces TaxID=2593676 RepID=UPI002E173479|nr:MULTISPECIES: hypothetical protein [unclassified Streptomyces]
MTEQPGDRLRRTQPAWELLEDKILVHTAASITNGKIPALGLEEHDGIILCGAGALATAANFQRQGRDPRPTLVDPNSYKQPATADEPFQLGAGVIPGQASLFEDDEPSPLQVSHDIHLHNGATASLTPTRYIPGGNRQAVATATQAVRDLDPEQAVLTLPLDYQWLRQPHDLDYVIATLADLPHIKGIALGAARNPLATKGSVTALRYLIGSLDRVALIRTDLAGLDAFAHGALFAAIGMQTSMRHISPPGSGGPAMPKGRNVTTMVLHPQLMDYFKADVLADRYGNLRALCHCTVCQGRSITRFRHNPGDQEEANRHNVATWLPWADDLQRTTAGADRIEAWRRLCSDAVQARQQIREQLGSPDAFETPRWLKTWAGEPD